MMKGMFKRALGVVAAAAMAVTGMAALSGTANAADGETPDPGTTITVNNPVEGHTYAAYDFARFDFAGMVDDKATATVATTDTTLGGMIETAAGSAIQTWYNDNPQYQGNPAAYLTTLTGAGLRSFVDNMTGLADELDSATAAGSVTAKAADVTNGNATITGLEPGHWYFVTDTVGTGNNVTVRGKIAVVATTMVEDGNQVHSLTVNPDDRQSDINMMGKFDAKADSPTPTDENVTKTAYTDKKMETSIDGNGGSVEVGQTVYYKVEIKVPAAAADYTDYTMTITDTASAGIKVNNDFSVTVDEEPLADATVGGFTSNGFQPTTVTITVMNANKLAGKTITVTYSGVITKEITVNNTASNAVDVDGTGHKTHTVTSTGFTFTKYGVGDGKNVNTPVDQLTKLEGVSFTILNGGASAPALKFTKDAAGAYVPDPTTGAETVTTGTNGAVTVKGLKAGDYTVVESNQGASAQGYSTSYLAKFTIRVDKDGNVTMLGTNDHSLAKVDTANPNNVNVYNVKDFSQLPVTGAAGTVLFTVLGLLIAGAGVTVYMKSRNVRHALRA